jgi:hypothetical protein
MRTKAPKVFTVPRERMEVLSEEIDAITDALAHRKKELSRLPEILHLLRQLLHARKIELNQVGILSDSAGGDYPFGALPAIESKRFHPESWKEGLSGAEDTLLMENGPLSRRALFSLLYAHSAFGRSLFAWRNFAHSVRTRLANNSLAEEQAPIEPLLRLPKYYTPKKRPATMSEGA